MVTGSTPQLHLGAEDEVTRTVHPQPITYRILLAVRLIAATQSCAYRPEGDIHMSEIVLTLPSQHHHINDEYQSMYHYTEVP